jgi:tRNA threonylcarbamoyladenosine modification (KEOPS) complex  Pcc1 subunit
MITSTVRIPRSPQLTALLKAEQESFRHARTSYRVVEREGQIVVEITAEDATALKTVVSSLCRVVNVYEKARRV